MDADWLFDSSSIGRAFPSTRWQVRCPYPPSYAPLIAQFPNTVRRFVTNYSYFISPFVVASSWTKNFFSFEEVLGDEGPAPLSPLDLIAFQPFGLFFSEFYHREFPRKSANGLRTESVFQLRVRFKSEQLFDFRFGYRAFPVRRSCV